MGDHALYVLLTGRVQYILLRVRSYLLLVYVAVVIQVC